MEEGSIVKVPFITADGQIKKRPAVILKVFPAYNDFLCAAISGKLHNEVKGLDVLIEKEHPDFQLSGLPWPSLIRLSYIGTASKESIEGVIGNISQKVHKQLIERLCDFLKSTKVPDYPL